MLFRSGLGLQPGASLPPIMTEVEMRPVIEGKKKFDFKASIGDYCFWFLGKSEAKQREMFLGHGGMVTLYLKPDSKALPPKLPFSSVQRTHPIFQQVDVDGLLASLYALMDTFPKKSKEVFGTTVKEDPQFRGLVFILPLLSTASFFERPAAEVEAWFDLFDIYINESPRDKGIILASRLNLQEELGALCQSMKDDGFVYS